MVDIDRYRAAERQLFAAAGIEPKEHHLDLRRVGVNARLLETGDGEPTLCPRLRRADVEIVNDAGHLRGSTTPGAPPS
jgi:hypothetical protein